MALNVQLTEAERDLIANPPVGETIFNTTENRLQCRDDGGWVPCSILVGDTETVGVATSAIMSEEVGEGQAVTITAVVTAQEGAEADRASYQLTGSFHRLVGAANCVLNGQASLFLFESNAAYACVFAANGARAEIQVTGVAGQTIAWETTFEFTSADI